jgi:hypothetical protein
MAINNTLIGNLAATRIFLATAGSEYAITTIIFCNTSDSIDSYLDVWVVPSGGVPSIPATQILKSVFVPKTETFVMDTEKLILGSGDAIWAQTNPGAANFVVSATVSAVQIS